MKPTIATGETGQLPKLQDVVVQKPVLGLLMGNQQEWVNHPVADVINDLSTELDNFTRLFEFVASYVDDPRIHTLTLTVKALNRAAEDLTAFAYATLRDASEKGEK